MTKLYFQVFVHNYHGTMHGICSPNLLAQGLQGALEGLRASSVVQFRQSFCAFVQISEFRKFSVLTPI